MSFFKNMFEKQPPGPAEQKRIENLALVGIIGIMWIVPIISALLNFWLDNWLEGEFNSKIILLVLAISFGPLISLFYILKKGPLIFIRV